MKNLRELIEEVSSKKPDAPKEQLLIAVITKVKKIGFYTFEELAIIEEELTERLRNY